MMVDLDLSRYGLVSPVDESIAPARTSSAARSDATTAEPVDGLQDAKVEFLWNGKPNGDVLLKTVEQRLCETYHIHSLGVTAKLLPNTAAPEQLLSDIAARASLVFTGPGD